MSAFTVSAAAPTVQVRASVGPARRGASVRVSQVSRDADPIHSSHLDVTYDTMERYTGISAPCTAVHRVVSAAVHAEDWIGYRSSGTFPRHRFDPTN
ncbi:hypothetical protein N9M16_03755 [Candidatus Dependentiae bacterium]|nr:hypothetical protein [Candidatus Dependentiae bacterium]